MTAAMALVMVFSAFRVVVEKSKVSVHPISYLRYIDNADISKMRRISRDISKLVLSSLIIPAFAGMLGVKSGGL
jgi:hypothetical protein